MWLHLAVPAFAQGLKTSNKDSKTRKSPIKTLISIYRQHLLTFENVFWRLRMCAWSCPRTPLTWTLMKLLTIVSVILSGKVMMRFRPCRQGCLLQRVRGLSPSPNITNTSSITNTSLTLLYTLSPSPNITATSIHYLLTCFRMCACVCVCVCVYTVCVCVRACVCV